MQQDQKNQVRCVNISLSTTPSRFLCWSEKLLCGQSIHFVLDKFTSEPCGCYVSTNNLNCCKNAGKTLLKRYLTWLLLVRLVRNNPLDMLRGNFRFEKCSLRTVDGPQWQYLILIKLVERWKKFLTILKQRKITDTFAYFKADWHHSIVHGESGAV